MGDEVVLIYEATGKVVRPGGLPIEEGIAVFNVETMYNIHLSLIHIFSGCKKIFLVDSKAGTGVSDILDYLNEEQA